MLEAFLAAAVFAAVAGPVAFVAARLSTTPGEFDDPSDPNPLNTVGRILYQRSALIATAAGSLSVFGMTMLGLDGAFFFAALLWLLVGAFGCFHAFTVLGDPAVPTRYEHQMPYAKHRVIEEHGWSWAVQEMLGGRVAQAVRKPNEKQKHTYL
jgi:hypothetical protein